MPDYVLMIRTLSRFATYQLLALMLGVAATYERRYGVIYFKYLVIVVAGRTSALVRTMHERKRHYKDTWQTFLL